MGVKPATLLLSDPQARVCQGAESLQLMNDFSQLTIDTAPRGRASGETIPGQEVRIQDDHSLTTIREELNNQNENIIKLGSMMAELAKTLTDMLHVRTLI